MRFRDFLDAWARYSISEIAEINPTTKTLPNDFYYIDLESVVKGNLIKDIRIRKSNAPSRAQRLVATNDILFQTVRPYQQNNYIFEKERDLPTVASTGYAQIRTNENPYFLYALLHTKTFLDEVMIRCTGSSYPAINCNDLGEIYVTIPTKKEQDCIANFIKLIDSRINAQDKLLTFLKSYKRGALQSIKVPTKTYCVGRIFNITRGYVLPTSNVSEQKSSSNCYPVYSSQTKNDGLMGYFNQYLYENAITWTTDGANAGYTRYREEKFYCTNVCGVLLNNDGYANEFVAEKINEISKKYVSYVGNPKLMNNVMSEIKIDLPTVEKQQHYSKLIALLNKLIDYNSKILDNLTDVKKSLLQQLFI